jgi:hypothetical protein
MNFKVSNYIITSDSLDGTESLQSEKIVYSTRTGKGIKITNYVLELLKLGQYTSIPDRLFTILMYHEVIVPELEDELETIVQRKLLTSIDVSKNSQCILVNSDLVKENTFKNKIIDEINSLLHIHIGKNIDSTTVLITIDKGIEKGFRLLDFIRTVVQENEFHNIDFSYKLHISAIDISSISEFLPLNNPGIERINFVHKGDNGSSFNQYIKSIAKLLRFHKYLSLVPIDIYIVFTEVSAYSNLLESIEQLKTLGDFENVNLHIVSFPKISSELKSFEQKESQLLENIAKDKIRMSFMPIIDSKYFDEKLFKRTFERIDVVSFARLGISDDNFEFSNLSFAKGSDVLAGGRVFYNSVYVDSLLKDKPKCISCVYLPLCGGRIKKNKTNDLDCPPFTRNFIQKIKNLYSIC